MPTLDFEALFDVSPNAYVLLDTDFTIVEANETYLEVTGREREDILGHSLFDAFPGDPEDSDDPSARRLRASFERVLSTGERDSLALIPYTIPRETDEGTVHEERYWSATHTPVFGEGGEVEFILQHTADVTDLYQTKEQLRAARQENREEETDESSPVAETHFGDAADRSGEREREDVGVSPEAGSPPHQVEGGIFARAQEVQQAYWASEEERERLQRLFDQAPGFMVFQRGPDHIYELANDAYLDLIDRRDIIGKPAREVLPELEEQGFFDLLDQVYESGEPFVGREVEARVQKESGEGVKTVYVDFIYQPVTGPGGEVVGIFTQGHDVTEKKRTKDRLRRQRARLEALNETLEERVEKRTRQVRELTSRVTMAEQRERRRIARALHDDLQQRLYGIQLKMTSLREGSSRAVSEEDLRSEEGPRSEEAVSEEGPGSEETVSEEERLLGQIREVEGELKEVIRKTRRLSVDMSPPVLQSEGLAAVLEWLQSHMRKTRDLEVGLEAEREFPMGGEMRVLLFQVVRELLVNVAQHAGVGRAVVELREEGEELLIRVIDEGEGFDPSEIERRGPEEGFGLTAARERLRPFGGTLAIEAAPGEGTQVTVRMPLDRISDESLGG